MSGRPQRVARSDDRFKCLSAGMNAIADGLNCPPDEIHATADHFNCPPPEIHATRDRIHCLQTEIHAMQDGFQLSSGRDSCDRRSDECDSAWDECDRGSHECDIQPQRSPTATERCTRVAWIRGDGTFASDVDSVDWQFRLFRNDR